MARSVSVSHLNGMMKLGNKAVCEVRRVWTDQRSRYCESRKARMILKVDGRVVGGKMEEAGRSGASPVKKLQN